MSTDEDRHRYIWMLEETSDVLQNDREVVSLIVGKNGMALMYASKELRGDREIVLSAVRERGQALQYASEEFKNDYDVVLAAVSQDGCALRYASDELKNHRVIAHTAVLQDGYAFKHVSKHLRNDKSFLMLFLRHPFGQGPKKLWTGKESTEKKPFEIWSAVTPDNYDHNVDRKSQMFKLHPNPTLWPVGGKAVPQPPHQHPHHGSLGPFNYTPVPNNPPYQYDYKADSQPRMF